MKDALRLMQERRSVRTAFDPDRPVAMEDIGQILEAARWAPTPHNMQNFEILVIDDRNVLEELGRVESRVTMAFLRENYEMLSFSHEELLKKKVGILGATFPPEMRDSSKFESLARDGAPTPLSRSIAGSPTLLVVVYDPTRRAPDSEGDVLGLIALGCVMENMWLMATSLGISVRVLSDFGDKGVEEKVKDVLGIPARLRTPYGLRLGYPRTRPQAPLRVRRDLADLAHHNRYGKRDLA
jgi:nitroreductase